MTENPFDLANARKLLAERWEAAKAAYALLQKRGNAITIGSFMASFERLCEAQNTFVIAEYDASPEGKQRAAERAQTLQLLTEAEMGKPGQTT